MSLSTGAIICEPSSQYTLYPLYFGLLWLAVIIIPAVHPSSLTAKDSSGTGLKWSNIYVFIPFAFNTKAAWVLNSGDILLESKLIATPLFSVPLFSM